EGAFGVHEQRIAVPLDHALGLATAESRIGGLLAVSGVVEVRSRSPMSLDILRATMSFGSACVTLAVMLEGAGNWPNSLLDALSFQLPLRSGVAAKAAEVASRANVRMRMQSPVRILDQSAKPNSIAVSRP